MSSTFDLRGGRVLKPLKERVPSRWRHLRATRMFRDPDGREAPPSKREAKLLAYPSRMTERARRKAARRKHGRP